MPTKHVTQGHLYEQAAQFAADLEHSTEAVAQDMLAAWSDSYWGIRHELDQVLGKIAAAKAAGTPFTPAWLYQADRLKATLATTKRELAKYADYASAATSAAQKAALAAGTAHAAKLAQSAVSVSLPGLSASLRDVNPAVLEHMVGFLHDGTVLADHLKATMPDDAAEALKRALFHGLATGQSQDQMLREATKAIGLSHTRATTILRTESLRAYRSASRATYMANQDILGEWVWNAHLDARTCIACAVMDGTVHPIDAVLDGHPRCRCAMIPRTKTWDEILGQTTDLPDTRPPIRDGKAWLADQAPHVQRAMMGPAKWDAWVKGDITLDDMVGRTYSPKWGTMRGERSLKAIAEDRNANWLDTAALPTPPAPPPPPTPNLAHAQYLADRYDDAFLAEWKANPAGNSPQALADLDAAIAYKAAKAKPRLGPVLPEPDPAKVDAALAKLAKAAEDKGYPSKGYSQVKAIYKAQANGIVGKPVGVVKSLTWEQKITAQKIIQEHDLALPKIVADLEAKATAKAAEKAAVREAYDEATKAADKAIIQAGGHDAAVAALNDLADAWADTGPVAAAKAKALAQVREAYEDAQASLKAHVGVWKPTNGAQGTLTIGEDGWGSIVFPEAQPIPFPPTTTAKALLGEPGKWELVLEPQPQAVASMLADLKSADGLIQQKWYKDLESMLDTVEPQTKVNIQETLDQAWASKWEPEADYVAKIKATLEGDPTFEADLVVKMNAPETKPLSKANLAKALEEWRAEKAAKATIDLPLPKPDIDPAKFDFAKASDAQVAKIKAKVSSGEWTLDDVYALFQKSKNSGPKTNYAKAILEMEGKPVPIAADWPTTVPLPANQFLHTTAKGTAKTLHSMLNKGQITVDEVVGYAVSPATPEMDYAAHQVLLDLYHDGKIGESFLEKAGLSKTPSLAKAPSVPPVVKPPPPSLPRTMPWKADELTYTGKTLGTHGAQVWESPDGTRWLFKPPKDPADGFLVTLDEAASRLQAQVGLKAPDTYTITLKGRRGSIQRMFQAEDAFPGGLKPTALSEGDLEAVQRQHVLDWLLSNHDGHRDQFLRLPTGDLVGIDKGQAFRWFGQDRLDWEFHPNQAYGAPEPVYNALWRAFAKGEDVALESPKTGALAKAIRDVQAVSDDDLRAMFRPYAEEAAARGLLAKPQSFPGLVKGSVPPNDVEAFLDALVARKHNLEKDFQDLYDRAAAARAKAIPGWKPTTPKVSKSAAKWVGKDKPPTPVPPKEPDQVGAEVFDTWLQAAKDRYAAFSGGKNLEASNNWARFRRVVENRDATALKELLDRNYLTQDAYDEGLVLIQKAEAKAKEAEAAYKTAQAAHARAMTRWRKNVTDWKEANGITDVVQGMDDGVVRHTTNPAGVRWAGRHFDHARYTTEQRTWLQSYTGSSYDEWNSHLRFTKGNPTQHVATIKHLDDAMAAQPIPEDVILHRGTVASSFTLDGRTLGSGDDLTSLIGSVQVDHGFMSTSVGNTAAFSSQPVQLKIRAPAGTPGAYVQMFSHYESERELILGRGTRMFVHNAYQRNGRWFVEVEIVPADFDPIGAIPSPSATPWTE